MKRHCLLIVFVALMMLGITRPADADEKRLTLATYNLYNLFDVFDDPYTRDEGTRVKPRSEIELCAHAIRALDADIVAVQEVENEHVLRAMVSEFLPEQGYQYIATSATNDGRGIRVGVLSRLPIVSITSYRFRPLTLPNDDRQWQISRDLMYVQVMAPGNRLLHFFNVHFKSKFDSEGDPKSGAWRLAEATEARRVIQGVLAADPEAWVALVGDFNDTPDSPPLQQFIGPLNGAPPLLKDSHTHIPASQRITYLKNPYRETIDFILVSPTLAKRLIPSATSVFAQAALLGGSDHAPVVASFKLD